jgi:hypothetical protein
MIVTTCLILWIPELLPEPLVELEGREVCDELEDPPPLQAVMAASATTPARGISRRIMIGPSPESRPRRSQR